MRDEATFRVKTGLAEMLKGGVIMDVVTPEQAKVAEDAGAAAVMALMRVITGEIKRLATLGPDELATAAKEHAAPLDLVTSVAGEGKLPVVLFCAGGIATPADAALMMALGAEGVFVGSGIFKSEDPPARARAIVEATTHWQDPERVAAASQGLGTAMASVESSKLEDEQLLAHRGW